VDIPADRKLHLDLELPETMPVGATELVLTFKNVSPGKPVLPRFSMERIEAWSRAPEIQSLVGALKGIDLPADVSIKDIREKRLEEKYDIGAITAEQLKNLPGSNGASPIYTKEVLERKEAMIDLARQYGKPHQEHSLFKHAGCLKDSGVFDRDAMEIQKEMRRNCGNGYKL
jgi:hypothetical protein